MKRVLIVVLLSLSMSLFLINCGGSGDGSGGIAYEGETSQVLIDEGNASSVAMNAYENGNSMQTMQGAGNVFGAVSIDGRAQMGTPNSVMLSQFVRDFLEQADLSGARSTDVMAAVSGSESMSGTCGGSANFSGTADEQSGSFDIKVTFSSYCTIEDGTSARITANGTIEMEGTILEGSMQLDMTFRNFEFTDSNTGESAKASGTMSMTMSGDTMNITMTMVMKNNTTGKIYKVENLVIDADGLSGFSMRGRFYDPDYGYVDIETTVAFEINYGSDNPTSGTMVITGKSNTKARFIVVSSTEYQVTADTNGDGTYVDVTGVQNW